MNDEYVRIYTRDEPEFMVLSWQARCLFLEIVRKVDGNGVLKVGRLGALGGIVIAVRGPATELAAPVAELLAEGRITFSLDRGEVTVPNHVEAQTDPRREAVRVRNEATRLRAAIIERDGLVCHICLGEVESSDVHIDHVLAVARGGQSVPENLAVAHSFCNQSKGAKVQ